VNTSGLGISFIAFIDTPVIAIPALSGAPPAPSKQAAPPIDSTAHGLPGFDPYVVAAGVLIKAQKQVSFLITASGAAP
jgi:hypothetical protein